MKRVLLGATALLTCSGLTAQASQPTRDRIADDEKTASHWYRQAWEALIVDAEAVDRVSGTVDLPDEWEELLDHVPIDGDYSSTAFTGPVDRAERALNFVYLSTAAGPLRYPDDHLAVRGRMFLANLQTLYIATRLFTVRSVQRLNSGVVETSSKDMETLLALALQLHRSEYALGGIQASSIETTVSEWVRHAHERGMLDDAMQTAWATRLEKQLTERDTPYRLAQESVAESLAFFEREAIPDDMPAEAERALLDSITQKAAALIAPLKTLDDSKLTVPLADDVRTRIEAQRTALEKQAEGVDADFDELMQRIIELGTPEPPSGADTKLLDEAIDRTAGLIAQSVAPDAAKLTEALAAARIDLVKAIDALE